MELDSDSDLFRDHLVQQQNPNLEKNFFIKKNITNMSTNEFTNPVLFPEENVNKFDNCSLFGFSNFPRNVYDNLSDDESKECFSFSPINWNKHANNLNRNSPNNSHIYSLSPNPFEEIEEKEKKEDNQIFFAQQPKLEIKSDFNIFKTIQKSENTPQRNEIKRKPLFKAVPKKWNENSLSNENYSIYVTTVFTLYGSIIHKKGKGRRENYLKQLPNTIISERSKIGNRADNFKVKVINTCFKSINFVIFYLFLAFGNEYKLYEINKKANELHDIKSIKKYLDKRMVDIVIESNPKKGDKTFKNRRIYDRLVQEGILDQSLILKTILNMRFGEVLHNFLIDYNFVKELEPNNNDFHTYNYYKDTFKEANYLDERIKSTQKDLIELTIKYES